MAGRSCLCKPHTSNLASFESPLGQVRASIRACELVGKADTIFQPGKWTGSVLWFTRTWIDREA
jgi:hypothetical protein